MKTFGENNQIDLCIASTGSTTLRYGFPAFDMRDYDRADFIITAPRLGSTASAINVVSAQVYTATAATSTSLTGLSSATASFGATLSSVPNIAGAQVAYVSFADTVNTGVTFSVGGRTITMSATDDATGFECKADGSSAANSLAAMINSTKNTWYTKYMASTDFVVGATGLGATMVAIYSRDGSTVAPAILGAVGATAGEDVRCYGDFQARIGVPTEKLPSGGRFITIGIKSSAVGGYPLNVTLIRSRGRSGPAANGGLAANVNLGSTS